MVIAVDGDLAGENERIKVWSASLTGGQQKSTRSTIEMSPRPIDHEITSSVNSPRLYRPNRPRDRGLSSFERPPAGGIPVPDPERTDRGEELSRLSRRYLPLSRSTVRSGEPVVLSPVPTHQFQRDIDDRTRRNPLP